MPIYEFYCADCHRVFSFLSRTVDTQKRPACPRCGRRELARRASRFAISKGRPESPAPEPGAGPEAGGPDEQRLMRAFESLGAEAEGLDESDPRQSARLMRRLFGAAGMPVSGRMEEALRRLEAGEDPDKVEEEMGDAFDEDPFAGPAGEEQAAPATGSRGLLKRLRPPSVDPELHEM
jgi:putative FmdB family regulatory protein